MHTIISTNNVLVIVEILVGATAKLAGHTNALDHEEVIHKEVIHKSFM